MSVQEALGEVAQSDDLSGSGYSLALGLAVAWVKE